MSGNMEARAGIEPACEDLQSSASPLRHRASMRNRVVTAPLTNSSRSGNAFLSQIFHAQRIFIEESRASHGTTSQKAPANPQCRLGAALFKGYARAEHDSLLYCNCNTACSGLGVVPVMGPANRIDTDGNQIERIHCC